MYNVILNNTSPMCALFSFVLGNGLFGTYLANELALKQTSPVSIGLLTTFLYAGLVFGSFKIEKIISRVAHIRAYAAFASIIAIIPLLHMLFANIYLWFALRFLCGIATAGIYVVIESWLLSNATNRNRGKVLAIYMITFYASQSLGQLLLKVDNHQGILIYVMISMLTSLSVLPMTLAKTSMPTYSEPSTLNLRKLYYKCASGLFGCFFGGLILGALYGLFPMFILSVIGNPNAVANNMFVLILGGMILQYPIGRISDAIERRLVLLFICLASIFILLAMTFFIHSQYIFWFLTLLFGGCTFTIYPVSISYGCDSLDSKDIVSGTQTLLLAYSLGAMVGPLLASILMTTSPWWLIAYISLCCAILIGLLSWRKVVSDPNQQEEQFISVTQNTPIIIEADPRADDN